MSPFWGNLIGVMTLTLMLLFIGIWIWLWRKRHKKTFDRMARLPMEDEMDSQNTDQPTGSDHHE